MEFKEVLQNRISTRSYNGKPVTKEQVDEILTLMRLAPTARHLESYRVKVSVGDADFVEQIGNSNGQIDRIRGCGAVMVFFAEPQNVVSKYGDKDLGVFCLQDATLACAYAQLAATDLGLSTLWMGAFDDEKLKDICGVAGSNLRPSSILILGHSDENPERSTRKDLNEILL